MAQRDAGVQSGGAGVRRVDRVVLLALDGMRADMLSPEVTPHLWRLSRQAHRFANARSCFPSYTRVCTAAVMTGADPASHGVIGNAFHHRAAGLDRPLFLDRASDVARLIELDGRAMLVPTLDEVLASADLRLAAINGNSAGTAALMLPRPTPRGHWLFNPNGRATATDTDAWDAVIARFGEPPPHEVPLLARTAWLGRVFAEEVLGRLRPDVALLWLAEPDTSMHYRSPSSPDATQALRIADVAVGLAIDAIERTGDGRRTAVIAFSDHGQIACPDQAKLPASWADLGIGIELGRDANAVATLGRCGGITLGPERGERLAALAAALVSRPEIGMLFSRGGSGSVPGTLPFGALGLDHPRAPDLLYVLADGGLDGGEGWTSAGDVPPGGGMHGGLHPGELANLLLVAWPDAGMAVREAPAGLVDIAPTILGMLGLPVPASMMGRDLTMPDPPWAEHRVAASLGGYRQAASLATCGRATYALQGGRVR